MLLSRQGATPTTAAYTRPAADERGTASFENFRLDREMDARAQAVWIALLQCAQLPSLEEMHSIRVGELRRLAITKHES